MADTTSNPNTAQTPTTPVKKAIFGGNQEAFENLEKFEQLTNPLENDEEIDFEFDELLDQETEEKTDSTEEDQASEYAFPVNEATPAQSAPEAENEDFILPSNEANKPIEAENVFEAAIQAPSAPEENFQMPFEVEVEPEITESETFEKAEEKPDLMPEDLADEALSENEETPAFEEELPYEKALDEQDNPESLSDFSPFANEAIEQELPAFPLASETPVQDEATNETVSNEAIAEVEENLSEKEKKEEKPEAQAELSAEIIAHQQMEAEPVKEQTKFMMKFSKLMELTQQIFSSQRSLEQEITEIELLGSNTQKSMIRYLVNEVPRSEGAMLQIKKVEKNYADGTEEEHILHLFPKQSDKNLTIIVDEFPLYEEDRDFSEPLKAAIVNDKLNKFDLLLSEKLKPLQAELAEKKAKAEQEKAFRSIFREF